MNRRPVMRPTTGQWLVVVLFAAVAVFLVAVGAWKSSFLLTGSSASGTVTDVRREQCSTRTSYFPCWRAVVTFERDGQVVSDTVAGGPKVPVSDDPTGDSLLDKRVDVYYRNGSYEVRSETYWGVGILLFGLVFAVVPVRFAYSQLPGVRARALASRQQEEGESALRARLAEQPSGEGQQRQGGTPG